MSITFIESPPFVVDFQQFHVKENEKPELSLTQKVEAVALLTFQAVKILFLALREATYKTLSNSGTSFKYIVLGYYGSLSRFHPPADIYLAVFKVFIWILGMGWCVTTTTNQIFWDKMFPKTSSFLSRFSDQINMLHIYTKELSLDVSGVPKEVKVDDLSKIYVEINFTQKELPGYMSSLSRTEDNKTYTVEELKEGLNTFINNVNKRVAFLGTPPAYDTPKLMDFYQQIEDAVRLSLHKVNQNFKEFQDTKGSDPTKYDQKQMNTYKDLLESKARVAIDLAIAGKHCGARFMGESMSVYFNLLGENSIEAGPLSDQLIELLAQKRKVIALKHIYQIAKGSQTTHTFNKYMAYLGKPLGIPGTQNIIEHIDRSFDSNLHISKFFEDYTVDTIIETIQDKIKKSNNFRMKIVDWIRDQAGIWNEEKYRGQQTEVFKKVNDILNDKEKESFHLVYFSQFQSLILHLRKTGVVIPDASKWNEFLEDVLALDEAKTCFKNLNSELNPLQLATKKNNLKLALFAEKVGPRLLEDLKNLILNSKELKEELVTKRLSNLDKMKRIREVITLEEETIDRIFEGRIDLADAIKDNIDLERRREFIQHFNLENMETEGISDKLIEWLLVSHNILLPQG